MLLIISFVIIGNIVFRKRYRVCDLRLSMFVIKLFFVEVFVIELKYKIFVKVFLSVGDENCIYCGRLRICLLKLE